MLIAVAFRFCSILAFSSHFLFDFFLSFFFPTWIYGYLVLVSYCTHCCYFYSEVFNSQFIFQTQDLKKINTWLISNKLITCFNSENLNKKIAIRNVESGTTVVCTYCTYIDTYHLEVLLGIGSGIFAYFSLSLESFLKNGPLKIK